jgi:hypothetical protein
VVTVLQVCGLFALPDQSIAQGQTDQLGLLLGTVPAAPSRPGVAPKPSENAGRARALITLRAGESIILRSGLSGTPQSSPLLFKLGKKPACGEARETAQGIVLIARPECAGQTLEFDYTISASSAAPGQQAIVNTTVQALVLSGVTSCGIADAPYEFVNIPGGSYLLKDLPASLSDLADLIGIKIATVEPFCITEEAIPAAEMEAFLAMQSIAEKRRAFPEALEGGPPIRALVESGRSSRVPAQSISHRMASAYAKKQSDLTDRGFELPRLEHYLAAAVHLALRQPDLPSTQSFLVSLHSGLMEWTSTSCETTRDAFVVVGTSLQTRLLERYCYAVSQRASRMGFRLVTRPRGDSGASSQVSK